MVEHLPLVRLPIAWWGTTVKDCWLTATFLCRFMSILVTGATIRSMALAQKRPDPSRAEAPPKKWLGLSQKIIHACFSRPPPFPVLVGVDLGRLR